jgi:hypothetical protein
MDFGVLMDQDRDDAANLAPTVTLAKLYEEQGFLDKAASVYKKLLVIEPGRAEVGRYHPTHPETWDTNLVEALEGVGTSNCREEENGGSRK